MPIESVKKLRPVVYMYEGDLDDGLEHFGFIAQELEEIFPPDVYGVVTEDDNGMKMVRYHEIIPLLTKYIHHLEERVTKLEKFVEEK